VRRRRRWLWALVGVVSGWLAVACDGGGGTGGGGPGSCPEPTYEQCTDIDWLVRDECGMAEQEAMRADPASTCNRLLEQQAEPATEGLAEETILLPPELGGGTAVARVVPSPERGVNELDLPPSALAFRQTTLVEGDEGGLSDEDLALRAAWDANGNRVESCAEYVYEKYYDYSRFQDAIVGRHTDAAYIVEQVFGPADEVAGIGSRVMDGEYLKMKDGSPGPIHAPAACVCSALDCGGSYGGGPFALQNIFFGLPAGLYEEVRDELDPEFEQMPGHGFGHERCYSLCESCVGFEAAPPDFWKWHQDRRAAAEAEGWTALEQNAMYATAEEFRQTLADWLTVQYPPSCCAESMEDDPCCPDYEATKASLEARLLELFRLGIAAGCLDPGATTICDWSPAFFVDRLEAAFAGPMEANFQRCLDLTGDDFEALSSHQFLMPDGTLWYDYQHPTMGGYTATARDVDRFFADHEAWKAAVVQWYEAQLPSYLFDAQGNIHPPGGRWFDDWSASAGPSSISFGVYFGYDVGWGLTGFEPVAERETADLCLVGVQATASFHAGGWAFGSDPFDVVDVHARAGLATTSEGHLKVLGETIWSQDPVEEWMIAVSPSVSKTVKKTKYYYIPDTPFGVYITGGVTGTLGLNAVLTSVPGREGTGDLDGNGHLDGAETCTLAAEFDADIIPWVRLQGFADAGPLAAFFTVGLGCRLTFLQLDFPFHLDVDLTSVEPTAGSVNFHVGTNLDLVVKTLDGAIYVVVRVAGLKIVKHDLFDWTGLSWTFPLDEYTTDVGLEWLRMAMRNQAEVPGGAP